MYVPIVHFTGTSEELIRSSPRNKSRDSIYLSSAAKPPAVLLSCGYRTSPGAVGRAKTVGEKKKFAPINPTMDETNTFRLKRIFLRDKFVSHDSTINSESINAVAFLPELRFLENSDNFSKYSYRIIFDINQTLVISHELPEHPKYRIAKCSHCNELLKNI